MPTERNAYPVTNVCASQKEIDYVLYLEFCIVWIRYLDTEKVGAQLFGELRNVIWKKMEKIKWPGKVTNGEVIERIGEKRTLLSCVLRKKYSCTGHKFRRNCLFHDVVKGHHVKLEAFSNVSGILSLKSDKDILNLRMLTSILVIQNLGNMCRGKVYDVLEGQWIT